MGKTRTPSFIHEFKLQPEPWQADIILNKLDTGRQIYNACLGEGFKRLKLMEESVQYKKTLKEYKEAKKSKDEKKLKGLYDKFNELSKRFNLTDADLQSFALKFRHGQFDKLLDSHSTQKFASRAYKAIHEYQLGIRGKPRFKKFGQIKSIEGKNNKTSVRFIDGKMLLGKMKVNVQYDKKDTYGVEANALLSNVKYCRIVAKDIRCKERFYLQLILEGTPKDKHKEAREQNKGKVIGIDLGPQTIAYVSESKAEVRILAQEIERINKKKAKLQKNLARKLRLNNKENFQPDKYVKKDKKTVKKQGKLKPKAERQPWVKSNSYKKLQAKLKEISRKEKVIREESHNRFINQLLTQGNNFQLEKINYKAWQKMFGKSIGARAPGLFVELLRHKAGNAGGNVYEFNTQTTALSQMCICGKKEKKSLSTRFHHCECGVVVQRDIFSAYLSLFVHDNLLDLEKAKRFFPGVEHSLRLAIHNLNGMSPSELKVLGIKSSEIEFLANLISCTKPTVVVDVVGSCEPRATSLVVSSLEPSPFRAV